MSRNQQTRDKARPKVEWAFGALSAAVVAALMAFLAHEALFGGDRPPDLRATVETVQAMENGTLVIVSVRNDGDQAAGDVAVTAKRSTGAQDAVKTIRFDYIAAQGIRRGAFMLADQGIERGDLAIDIQGYVEP